MSQDHFAVISASVREGARSPRVARYMERSIIATGATCDRIELAELGFPVFTERLRLQKQPDTQVLAFAERFRRAQGVIIVTPEYNGGYPAALKNVVDLLYDEWHRKPVAIVTVSEGSFGGTQVITSLQFTLWKMRAWTATAQMPVPNVEDAFAEDGTPADPDRWARRSAPMLNELGWCIEALRRMQG